MANSFIEITFTQDLPVDAFLGIEVGYDVLPAPWFPIFPNLYYFWWKNTRTAPFEVTIGTPTATPGERTAINFVDALTIDTVGSGYIIERNINVVKISIVSIINGAYGSSVGIFTSPLGILVAPAPNHPSIGINIFNASLSPFSISSVGFSQSTTTPCLNVDVDITTNELATEIISPISVNPNTQNPFTINVLRGSEFNLQIKNAGGDILNELIVAPALLSLSNLLTTILNTPTGAGLTVTMTNSNGLDLEYSLDGTNWQASNVFSGLMEGSYTLHVRDQLGCSISKNIIINATGIYTPYFYLSKSNSIRFANRITWGDAANYKNDDNTLSCEVDALVPYKETQLFQSADIITTQFQSNFELNEVKIIKYDNSEVVVPIVKKSNNLNQKIKMDARKTSVDGKTAIYFLSGNNYDYATNIVTGTHALNGDMPIWGRVGNYIQIGAVWYLIEKIIYDDVRSAYLILLEENYTGADVNLVVGSIYNLEAFEVYEFDIDMSNYLEERIRVKIVSSSDGFTTITNLSEEIYVKVRHLKTLEIKYYNNTNTDIDYSTGIVHKIRIPYIKMTGKSEGDSEINKTDTSVELISANLYELKEIEFLPLTEQIWRKVMIALSHENVFIDEVGYLKEGDFSSEQKDDSNLYLLKASVIKTGTTYNSKTSGDIGFNGSIGEIPGLIEHDSGFVEY